MTTTSPSSLEKAREIINSGCRISKQDSSPCGMELEEAIALLLDTQRQEVLEKAAKVADSVVEGYYGDICREIAQAIRSLKSQEGVE